MFRTLIPPWFALALGLVSANANPVKNPFFPMDTAIRSTSLIDLAADLGFQGIGWRPESPEKLSATLQKLRERNLSLFAIYTGVTLEEGKLQWPKMIEDILPVLQGTHTILWLTVAAKNFRPSDPTPDAEVAVGLRKLAQQAGRYGVRIALYPHTGSWVERVQDATRVARKVDHPALGVTFNLCHCLNVGDEAQIPELVRDAGKNLFLVTLNGADANAPHSSWKRLIRPLDEGDFPVSALLKTLQENNYEGPIGLQGFGIPLPAEENLRRSMDAWRRIQSASR